MENLRKQDPDILHALNLELQRQRDNIELIASENIVSEAVLEAMGSALTNKYAEGYPGKRFYGGCEYVDIAEDIARKRAIELFGAEHATYSPTPVLKPTWQFIWRHSSLAILYLV